MKSKRIIACYLLVCLLACSALASYTYVITEYQPLSSLHDTESMLVKDNGGGGSITLYDNSFMKIEGTSPLEDGTGGIWQIGLTAYSHLDFSGGEVHTLSLGNYATATLSGGLIVEIWSTQKAWKWAGDPPQYVPDPHIEIIYSGDLPTVDENNLLTGAWGNGSAFSIQLIDVQGYSPTIENIFFTPEPATLVLFGLGGLFLRRRDHV